MNNTAPNVASWRTIFFLFILANLSACGGSSNSSAVVDVETNDIDTWVPGVFRPEADFVAKCAIPRNAINPQTGLRYRDTQGSVLDENNWLRSWSDNLYLWYNEILDQDPAGFSSPQDYFPELKTFATTSSGKAKDQFHFTVPTDEYQQQSQSGISAGYGVTFTLNSNTPPRELVVAYTEPASPATSAAVNLRRGTKILEVDGLDLVNSINTADLDPINAGLFPENIGETHTFKIQDVGSSSVRTVTMRSEFVTSQPVQNVTIIETQTGKVGYLLFNDHIATAEQQLIDAISRFELEGVDDLVLDLRYNGGGALYIALELGSMIAGGANVEGQMVGTLEYNDKNASANQSFPFLTHTPSFSPSPGRKLPSLNLPRVFVLTGSGTCSASETIINGLRGIDLEVIQIGSTTCGKPYGFIPTDNCGTTYFSINFRSVNAKGFGDYADGFSPLDALETGGVRLPGCSVADDFSQQLGDVSERRLATALFYRDNLNCPQSLARAKAVRQQPFSSVDGETLKPLWLKNAMIQSMTNAMTSVRP